MSMFGKIIKMKTIITFSLLMLSLTIKAQTVNIYGAVSSISGERLLEATAELNSLNGHVATTKTDNEGKFQFVSIAKNQSYRLLISHAGYISFDSSFYINDPSALSELMLGEIKISPSYKNMGEVVIKNQPKLITFSTGKVSLSIFQSDIASNKNLYDALKLIPGVVEQNGNLSFQGSSISIYIDDRQSFLKGEDLKTFLQSQPANIFEKAEILTNPGAGYDGTGGVVLNIKSQKNKNLGTRGSFSVSTGVGKFLQNSESIALNHRTNKLNLYGSYSFSHSLFNNVTLTSRDGIDRNTTIESGDLSRPTTNAHSVRLGFDWTPNKTNTFGFLFNGRVMDRVTQKTGHVYPESDGYITDSAATMAALSAKYKIPALNVYFKKLSLSQKRSVTVNFDYFNYDKRTNGNYTTSFFKQHVVDSYKKEIFRETTPVFNRVYTGSVDFSNKIEGGNVTTGIKTYFTKTDNDTRWAERADEFMGWETDFRKTNRFVFNEDIVAGYAVVKKKIRNVSINAGLRYEYTFTKGIIKTKGESDMHHYGTLFPNVSADYTINGKHSAGFSFRRSINRFGLNIVNPFIYYISPYQYSQGNPDIQPEISNTGKISYIYDNILSFSLNYSHTNRALAPVYRNIDDTLVSSYDNLSNGRTFYLANSYFVALTDWWDFSLSNMVGFTSFRQLRNGKNILNNSNWMYQGSLSSDFTISERVTADVSVMYLSPFSQGIYKTQHLFQTDIGFGWVLSENKRTSVRFSAEDIFNTFGYRYTVDYQGVSSRFYEKTESQFFRVRFSYKFGNSKVRPTQTRELTSDEIKNRMN